MTGTIFEALGVPVILNAAGTLTRLSGAPMRPEVAAAMAEASGHCVDMTSLQAAASRRIAAATGAEAGYVTPGAAAALLIGAAACITGLERKRMARLPQGPLARREIVMLRSQRNSYDIALRLAGAHLVEVGLPDRTAGAGVREGDASEIADAIGEETAAVFYVADRQENLPLADVVAVAHAAGLPVLVDAAAQLPPAENLRRFIAAGADLVAFSGGKAIGGPAASGILCGRADLVAAAALQHLDLDVYAHLWRPPEGFIDVAAIGAPPRHGVGRPAKIGKEQVVGLLTALDLFCAEGDAVRHARWLATLEAIRAPLAADARIAALGIALALSDANDVARVPLLSIALPAPRAGEAAALIEALERGAPIVSVDQRAHRAGRLVLNPVCLAGADAPKVADAIAAAVRATFGA